MLSVTYIDNQIFYSESYTSVMSKFSVLILVGNVHND